MYSILFEKGVIKFLKKLEQIPRERIVTKIELLKQDPHPSDAKRIVNADKVFRIRVGKYRVLYRIEDKNIIIFLIGKRDRVYDN